MARIVVKIGSNVITRADGTLDVTRMSALVDQVAELRRDGYQIILVSSGAVAAGRNEISPSHRLDTVSARQLYSAVGQAKLINRYYELFRDHGLVCGQILTTKEVRSRTHYLNQKHCMEVMLAQDVIPVINENDTISVTELMFTDNDELSGLIATMMDADTLVILSNIDGIYNGNPADPESKVIREVAKDVADLSEVVVAGKSTFGRGGMLTKSRIALKVASEGIEVIIANGKTDNILPRLFADHDTVCTRIMPGDRVNSVKKWIAHSHDFVKGTLTANEGAAKSLARLFKGFKSSPGGDYVGRRQFRERGSCAHCVCRRIACRSGMQRILFRLSQGSGWHERAETCRALRLPVYRMNRFHQSALMSLK